MRECKGDRIYRCKQNLYNVTAEEILVKVSDTHRVTKAERRSNKRGIETREKGEDGNILNLRSVAMSTMRSNTIHYPASGWVDRELLTPSPVERDHKLFVQ